MALFRDVVSREQYEDMKRARDTWQEECAYLRAELSQTMRDLIAVKRHELGLPPAGFEPKDPMQQIGKKTRAAIEEMGRGYSELQNSLLNFALTELMKVDDPDEAFDADLARRIYDGDTA